MSEATLAIGANRIELSDDRITTVLADGAEVPATPNHRPEDIARAQALGYGDDTAWMSRDHEIVHALLATWLGLPESPTMRGVAIGDYWPHWREEEAAVLAIQRLCQTLGVDVVALAQEQAGPTRDPVSHKANGASLPDPPRELNALDRCERL